MWVISTGYRSYVREILTGWEAVSLRDNATQFTSRQEAKDFMAEHSITGSIIPY